MGNLIFCQIVYKILSKNGVNFHFICHWRLTLGNDVSITTYCRVNIEWTGRDSTRWLMNFYSAGVIIEWNLLLNEWNLLLNEMDGVKYSSHIFKESRYLISFAVWGYKDILSHRVPLHGVNPGGGGGGYILHFWGRGWPVEISPTLFRMETNFRLIKLLIMLTNLI